LGTWVVRANRRDSHRASRPTADPAESLSLWRSQARHPTRSPPELTALARDGYIFVIQNVRDRFKSEGVFAVSTLVHATDAYDTIDSLVKNLAGNNGRGGVYGVSYAGLTAALTLLYSHPGLKAVSEQGASADEWMNDDFHRYGALRESYAFEYAVREVTTFQSGSST
jgi:predicted acyl esterase